MSETAATRLHAGEEKDAVHPVLDRVTSLARTTLKSRKLLTDSEGVPAGIITMLREAGALNHLATPLYGGAGMGRADDRQLHELIAGGCLNTWLVWAQHASIAARVETSLQGRAPEHALVEGLLRGQVFAGAALSDVRRYPERYIEAERVKGGWQFQGTVSWASGWGLNQVLLVAGVERGSEQVVLALVPVSERFKAAPLYLAALAGSRTARVELNNVFVEDALVLSVEALSVWRARDEQTAVDAKPHLFGLAAAALEELQDEPAPLAREAADAWAPRLKRLRSRAYALADAQDAAGFHEERLRIRVQAGDALDKVAKALFVARAGRSLQGTNSAQYYLRCAHFLLVQGQTDSVRAAQLTALR